MEDKDQSKTVHNDGITLPAHDFAGLGHAISSAKPSLPGTENGFIPLKSCDFTKPYEDIATFLTNWEQRLSDHSLQPEQLIKELKDAKKVLVDKHDSDFEQRITDIKTGYGEQKSEWQEHHRAMLDLFTKWVDEWKARVHPLETKNNILEEERLNTLVDYYNTRLQELVNYHEESKAGLNGQIEDLKIREQTLNTKIADLEQERGRWLDERRDWLLGREEKFDAEKQGERDVFNTLRKQVVKSEHPLCEDQTPTQIAAEYFKWRAAIVVSILIICSTVLLGICLYRGNTIERISSTTTTTTTSPAETTTKTTLKPDADATP